MNADYVSKMNSREIMELVWYLPDAKKDRFYRLRNKYRFEKISFNQSYQKAFLETINKEVA